jgi:Tol biopolymer transport system component
MGKISPMGLTRKGYLYYGLQTQMNNVYTAAIDLEKSKLITPPAEAVQNFVGSNTHASWSPDGKYLAYKSTRSSFPRNLQSEVLCIRSMETGKDRELHPKIQKYWPLHWSPDGRFIITTEDGKKIYKIDAQTGDVTLLVESASKERIIWPILSTDGKKIFFLRIPPPTPSLKKRSYRIVEYDLTTKQEKEIYRDPGRIADLTLSPDGQLMAFLKRDRKKLWRILKVIPVAGGEPLEVLRSEKGGGITTIAWMPDGKRLLFAKGTTKEKDCELWQIPSEGGKPQKIGGLGMDRVYIMSIHPDGKRIAFYTRGARTKIWVMENFLPKGK